MGYVDLHSHGAYSHDGFSSSDQAAHYAKSIGQIALARTEHGNMMSAVELEQACLKYGLKPLPGCEIYYQPTFYKDRKASKKDAILGYKAKRYHLTVLAKNNNGYNNLSQMLTIANRDTFYYFPVVTHASLIAHKDGLIILSGCISSYLSQSILSLDEYMSRAYIETMLNQFGTDFYLETQPITVPNNPGEMTDPQEYLNDMLLRYGDDYGIPIVATTDAHYPSPELYDTFLVSHAMRKHHDPIADYSQRYLHSEQEMRESWEQTMGNKHCQALLDETVTIANRINVTIARDIQMTPLDWAKNPDDMLQVLCNNALDMLSTKKCIEKDLYQHRLQEELDAFKTKGFSSYLLLGYDIADFCLCNKILMSARGSVCGSLVAYLLRISNIDPIEHGTVFDRFFSLERTNWPDIDYDIQDDRRDEVITYLEKMHPGHSAQIVSINRWKTRNLVRDLSAHFAVGPLNRDMITQLLESINYDENPLDYQSLMSHSQFSSFDKEVPGFLSNFTALHGQMTHIGQHASGLVITRDPIDQVMPLVRQPRTGKLLTSFAMAEIEYVGGLKIDLLGVAALRAIAEAESEAGIVFQESDIQNPEIYKQLARSNTTGIFQFGSRMARDMLRKGKPTDIQAIAALTALNRPVPLQEGSFDLYLEGREGNINTASLLYPYTQDTFGALIYQEQVMALCIGLAGFSRGDVDKVLKMLKKYKSDDTDLHLKFIAGCQSNNVPFTDAEHIWQTIRRYLFCKAHALSYAYLSIRQMNIKIKSPYAWYLSLLRQESDSKKQQQYCADALQVPPASRVYFLPPHVNGEINFSGEMHGDRPFIRFGLSSIDGIGPTVAEAIYQERVKNGSYQSESDLVSRVPKRSLNSARIITLKNTGALEFDPVQVKANTRDLNQRLINYSRYER